MSKDFSEFGKRNAEAEDKGVAILVKQSSPDDDDSLGMKVPAFQNQFPLTQGRHPSTFARVTPVQVVIIAL